MLFKLFRMGFRVYSFFFPKSACNMARRMMMTPRLKSVELPPNDTGLRLLKPGGALYSWYNQGKTAVFIHGWEGGYKQFEPIIQIFINYGWTVHMIVAPGHLDLSEDESHPIKFAQALSDASLYIGHIDILVGHSMGAGIAGLLSSSILTPSKLVLVAGPATFDGVLRRFANFIGLRRQIHDQFVEHVSNHVNTPISELDLISKSRSIKADTLIIHDSLDKEIPFTDGLTLSNSIERAILFNTSGYGHRRVLQAPDVVEKILCFADVSATDPKQEYHPA